MDALSMKILEIMETDGYQNSSKITTQLAAQFGVAERTVYRRIKKLKDEKIIQVVVRTNMILLGLKYRARIGIKVEPRFMPDLIHYLTEHTSVTSVREVIGFFNVFVTVRSRSLEQLNHFVNFELINIQGIETKEVFLLTQPRKHFQFRLTREKNNVKNISDYNDSFFRSKYEFNEVESSMLEFLIKEGPISQKDMSLNLGIEKSKLNKHLRKMVENNLLKLEAEVAPEFSRYEMGAIIGIILNQCQDESIIDNIISLHNYIDTASFCIGRFNVMISARFQSTDEMNEYINEKLRSIKEIKSIECFPITKRHKYSLQRRNLEHLHFQNNGYAG